jgi:hypothetical protein
MARARAGRGLARRPRVSAGTPRGSCLRAHATPRDDIDSPLACFVLICGHHVVGRWPPGSLLYH